MSAFWFAKGSTPGQYAIGLGDFEIASINAKDDALASQWAHCMCAALNDRERRLRLAAQVENLEGED